jgi:threonine dehydrogenase-like Zn-dependent dehydrogenase
MSASMSMRSRPAAPTAMSILAAGLAARRSTSWCPMPTSTCSASPKEQAKAKILDLTMLTDILPTGFHGAVNAGVQAGSTVYVAGAGPVGLAAAAAARLLGAAVVMIGDFNKARLEHAKSVGFEPVDLSGDAPLGERIAQILKVPEVDAFIDCVGFEAKGSAETDQPAVVLNQAMEVTRPAGSIGIPGLYVTEDPGAKDEHAKHGSLSLRLGQGLVQVAQLSHRPDAGAAVQPPAVAGYPVGPLADCQDCQCEGHHSRCRARRLCGF